MTSIFLGLIMVSCKKESKVTFKASEFNSPPDQVKIYAWWHWMDGAITREGITKDLEAMHQQGIAGATILNVGRLLTNTDFGIPRIIFASPEWFDMYKWALHEANRLGMTIGVHNCDGWSTSGGPWITPATSMKEFTWSRTVAAGGRTIDTVLAQPFGNMNYYQDAAVVAFPAHRKLNSFLLARPEIRVNRSPGGKLLMDGNPVSQVILGKENAIDISFDQPFDAEKIMVHFRMERSWNDVKSVITPVEIMASTDGYNYWTVMGFNIGGANENAEREIPRTRSRYFRVVINRSGNIPDFVTLGISELELLKSNERPFYDPAVSSLQGKTVSAQYDESKEIFSTGKAEYSSTAIDPDSIILLSGFMARDGRLLWQAPKGRWNIIRFGFTTTGSMNAPATPEGTGLECDKMDTTALNLHFRNFPEKVIREAGRFKGNTFKYLFIDSWECGYQNWTGDFPAQFEKLRGYSILPWIPALCGGVVSDAPQTEAFLNDFRRTIADLVGERYYHHYSDLCHREGISLHTEVIYGGPVYPPLDILKSNSYIDVPMFEFWTSRNNTTGFVEYEPSERTDFDKPALAATVYNKPILASEAYTGYAHYSEAPWDLKLFGDRGYCSGINRMVLHSYVHQPFDKVPGMTLGIFASHFNRLNSWWNQVSGWFTYQARVQYFLQKGQVVSDVLFYNGDRQPEFSNYNEFYKLPAGYNAAECNAGLLKKAIVKNGTILLPGGQAFKLLVLPDDSVMELSTLYKIGSLILQGGMVYGPKPIKTISLHNYERNNKSLSGETRKIWGPIDGKNTLENKYGNGRIFWGIPLAEVLEKIRLLPDFEESNHGNINLLYIHKATESDDFYFVVNQENREVVRDLAFRVTGKSPEIWDPVYGTRKVPALYNEVDGRIHIPVCMNPKGSLLFLFTSDRPEVHIVAVKKDGKDEYPVTRATVPGVFYPEVVKNNQEIIFYPEKEGTYQFTSSEGKGFNVKAGKMETCEVSALKGEITFSNPAYGMGPRKMDISRLVSWTDYSDPDIKYFSGTAQYDLEFQIPKGFITPGDSMMMSLGNLRETATVTFNGHNLGDIWCPDYDFKVNGMILEGNNKLQVKVSNVYRNRILGDLIGYGKLHNLWTTSPIDQLLDKNMPLKESGLMGPVQFVKLSPVVIMKE